MTTDALVARIHQRPDKGVFHVTGGGSLLLADLLCVPGASNTVLEATVPYAQVALETLLGGNPDQACSADTARALAMCGYLRARALDPGEALFGFAITASLRTTSAKRGAHRAHMAMQTHSATHTWSLNLEKGARTRDAEERLVADVALTRIAEVLGIDVDPPVLRPGDAFAAEVAEGHPDVQALVLGETRAVGTPQPKALFPGAFNPLHDGHRAIAADAEARLGVPVIFEICIRNVDKPPLNYHDINRRLAQFDDPARVWLTNAPTFVEKARTAGGVTFVVGTDTVIRIANPRYYGDSVAQRDAILNELAHLGCRFLVYGREADGRFVALADLELPTVLATLCQGVAEAEFRHDISSTTIRNRSS